MRLYCLLMLLACPAFSAVNDHDLAFGDARLEAHLDAQGLVHVQGFVFEPVRSGKVTRTTRLGRQALLLGIDCHAGSAELELNVEQGVLHLSLQGQGSMNTEVAFPGPLEPEADDQWILPLNEGLKVPAKDTGFAFGFDYPLSAGHFISMPMLALQRGEHSLMVIDEERSDAALRMTTGPLSCFGFVQLRSQGLWGYTRKARMEYCGDYVDVARHYRSWAESQGYVKTLAAKQRENSEVGRLYGAVDLWRWQNGPNWAADPHPEVFAAELKALGITQVLWSHEVPSAESAFVIRKLGYLVGRYTNLQDLYPTDTPLNWVEKRGWPEQRVINADGSWRKGWVTKENGKDYVGGVRCALPGLDFLRSELKAQQAKIPYSAVFIDTTTATDMTECYDPQHPHDRRGDLSAKMALLDADSREFKLVTGSETGLDAAVPHLAYFEGMLSIGQFRLPDSGYDLFKAMEPTVPYIKFNISPKYRIPLFELVYHDCMVSYYYWGDSPTRMTQYWDERDLLCILYGQPPFWHIDPTLWARYKDRYLKSYADVVPVATRLAGKRMLGHTVLDEDGLIQETDWEGGLKLRVDFTKHRWRWVPRAEGIAPVINH